VRLSLKGRLASQQRGVLLLPAAAIVVHQLRYLLAYGSHAGAELAAQGHSYLSSLVPWAVFALAAGGGLFLRRLAAAARTGRASGGVRGSALAVWLGCWLSLLAIYATQEALEGMLATGHPGGLAGVCGHGGFWAVPVAAVVAALVAALLLLGRALVRSAAARKPRPRRPLAAASPTAVFSPLPRPLALAAAGRAPPLPLPSR
jgi:hypothetical protein